MLGVLEGCRASGEGDLRSSRHLACVGARDLGPFQGVLACPQDLLVEDQRTLYVLTRHTSTGSR